MNKVIILIAIVLTGAIGFAHRAFSSGGLNDGVTISQEKIDELPAEIGTWTLTGREAIGGTALDLLQCQASGNLAYQNPVDDAKVVVTLMSGPAGPLAAHTPEVCYSSKAYVIQSDTELLELSINDGTKPQLRVVNLVPRNDNHQPLTVVYGWHDGTDWRAPPPMWSRWEYGGTKSLVKIQVAIATDGNSSVASTANRREQVEKFLQTLLPVINQHL